MESQIPTAESSQQQVSGQSAFWILVTLALAAVTQPSTCSRRPGRNVIDGDIDLLRSLPGTCLFDGIIDVIVLCRALGDDDGDDDPVRRQQQQRRRRRLRAPLTANVTTVRLAITFLAVMPQAIKVFSLRGIPVTQVCAALYLFAAVTKLVIDFSRFETDGYYPVTDGPDSTMLSSAILLLSVLFISYSQCALEFGVWYHISSSAIIHLPPQVHDVRAWLQFSCVPIVFLQVLVWAARIMIPPFRRSLSAPYAVPVFGLYLLFVVSGIGETEEKLAETMERPKSVIGPPPAWAIHATDMFRYVTCVAIMSILIAKAIGVLGNLIARRGRVPTVEPDGTEPRVASQPLSLPIPNGPSTEPGPSGGHSADSNAISRRKFMGSLKSFMSWTLSLGAHTDRRLARLLNTESSDSTILAMTIFNLITTICYYLVWYDGTGTESPDWVNILG